MACEPKRISELTRTQKLYPADLFTIVLDGENKAINAKDLIDLIIKLVGGDGDALCLALQAKNLAIKASADAEQALKDVCKALVLALKALDTACSFSSRLDRIETIINTVEHLQDVINLFLTILEYLLNKDYRINATTVGNKTTYRLQVKNDEGIWTNADTTPIEVINYTGDGTYITVNEAGKISFDATRFPKYTGIAPVNVNSLRLISLDIEALAGEGITYDADNNNLNVTFPEGVDALGDLTTDTAITNPLPGDILYFVGGNVNKWVNKPLADLLLWKKASDANGDYLTPNDINKGSVGEQGTVRAGEIYSNTVLS